MMETVIDGLRRLGAMVERDPQTDHLVINDEYRACVVLSRCHQTGTGASRWLVRFEHAHPAHITIAVRMNPDNATVKDYYLLPALDMLGARIRLTEENGVDLDSYRFDDLEYFFALAERIPVEEVA